MNYPIYYRCWKLIYVLSKPNQREQIPKIRMSEIFCQIFQRPIKEGNLLYSNCYITSNVLFTLWYSHIHLAWWVGWCCHVKSTWFMQRFKISRGWWNGKLEQSVKRAMKTFDEVMIIYNCSGGPIRVREGSQHVNRDYLLFN